MPGDELATGEDGSTLATTGKRAEYETALNSQKVLNTPRTIEAARRLGLTMEDLAFRPFESFAIPGDLKERQHVRFEHFEKRRKERLAQVLSERAKVIADHARKGEMPGVQSAQFLSMLESLFEKEAKRLEGDLKSQLRQHSVLVKENELQLEKEAKQRDQALAREAKRLETKKRAAEQGDQTKEKNTLRLSKNGSMIEKLDKQFAEKQAAFEEELKAEEHRLAKWRESQSSSNAEKAAIYREKVDKMKEKNIQMLEERRINGEANLLKITEKINEVDMRRKADQMAREMRSQEQHLHLLDVRSNKDRIDRIENFRKDELKDQLDSNVERIETLIALKDQLLNQRKARAAKAAATKGSRGVSLKRDCAPGPGQYEVPTYLTELPVPKMVDGKDGHAAFIDAQTKITAKNPAPGTYSTNSLPNGDKLGIANVVVEFGKKDRDMFTDEIQRQKAFVPAPGRYELKPQFDHRTTSMKRESIDDQGLDKFSAKRYPKWARPATQTPGPAGYNVDEFQRKETLRRVQRSLPNLTKEMMPKSSGKV
eukprot:gnl/TRDRNA2_/TRDRNA2_136502_c0_seq1.p1 gnl/TRDRNA2_/TRDRNA2_136502_c0~~gnl/TRDRNA2_/TRDRNA2_136502_c0_seq1.p1  ORF type:complete len:540 (-),score=148.47 gnl/TRDRNA2_/TRDRNA2_136502_c0_seq1:136-1755(-)